MKFSKSIFFLSLQFLFGQILGSSSKRVFEKRDILPSDWAESHKPDPSTLIPVKIGLKQANIDRLEEFLNSVAHPQSSQYGQHWTPEQVAKTFAPTDKTVKIVQNWLIDSGIDRSRIRLTSSRGWLNFNATVNEVEGLLDCQYRVYRHTGGIEHLGKCNIYLIFLFIPNRLLATDSYSLPEELHPHVELIMPTLLISHSDPGTSMHFSLVKRKVDEVDTQLGLLRSLGSPTSDSLPKLKGPFAGFEKSSSGNDLSTCDEAITPDCLRALYNIQYKPVATDKNTFGIGKTIFLSTLVSIYNL